MAGSEASGRTGDSTRMGSSESSGELSLGGAEASGGEEWRSSGGEFHMAIMREHPLQWKTGRGRGRGRGRVARNFVQIGVY